MAAHWEDRRGVPPRNQSRLDFGGTVSADHSAIQTFPRGLTWVSRCLARPGQGLSPMRNICLERASQFYAHLASHCRVGGDCAAVFSLLDLLVVKGCNEN